MLDLHARRFARLLAGLLFISGPLSLLRHGLLNATLRTSNPFEPSNHANTRRFSKLIEAPCLNAAITPHLLRKQLG